MKMKALSCSVTKNMNLLCSLLTNRSIREKYGLSVLKNITLIQKAAENKINIHQLYYKNTSYLKFLEDFPTSVDDKFVIDDKLSCALVKIVGYVPDTLATFSIPKMNHSKEKFSTTKPSSEKLPITIICDNVRYYGNVGSMLKTFFYLNCQEFILTKGSVDIWNPKALESSDGCQLFHHNYIRTEQSWHNINHLIPHDSLVFYAESEKLSHQNSLKYKNLDCAITSGKNIVLIVGGETKGVSCEAKVFCSSRNGHALFIPMRKEVESLNGGVAASILLFEMAKILKKEN